MPYKPRDVAHMAGVKGEHAVQAPYCGTSRVHAIIAAGSGIEGASQWIGRQLPKHHVLLAPIYAPREDRLRWGDEHQLKPLHVISHSLKKETSDEPYILHIEGRKPRSLESTETASGKKNERKLFRIHPAFSLDPTHSEGFRRCGVEGYGKEGRSVCDAVVEAEGGAT